MNVDVTVRGEVPEDVVGVAERKLSVLERVAGGRVLRATAVLTSTRNPSVAERFAFEATFDVDGDVIVAQARARDAREAVDRLEATLRRRLVDHAGRLGENRSHRR